MTVQRLDHIAVEVDDFDNRLASLVDRCAMRLIRTGRRHRTGERIALLGDGTGFKIELIEAERAEPALAHLAFRVDDVAATYLDFIQSSWLSRSEPHPLPAARAETALVTDSAGLTIQLISYEPDSPDIGEWISGDASLDGPSEGAVSDAGRVRRGGGVRRSVTKDVVEVGTRADTTPATAARSPVSWQRAVGSGDDGPRGTVKSQGQRARRWYQLVSRVLVPLFSFALLIACWYAVSAAVGTRVLPTPHNTLDAIGKSHEDGVLWSDIRATSKRIAGAFTIALLGGLIVGCTLGLSKIAARIFGPWVTIAASVPSLLYLITAYLWVGLSDRGAMVGCSLIVMPMMTFAIWDGVKGLNPEMGEMARAFGVPKFTRVRSVVVPQITPFIFTAARTGLALTWRITIFAELLGRSSGVGYRIQYWYNLFNMERVLGAALPFVAVMLTLELAILRPLERYLFRWRRDEMR